MERFSPHFDLMLDWVPRSYPNRTGLERMFWWRKKSSSSNKARRSSRGPRRRDKK
jgi:hypothetical protein